jgi:hypothetical protein
MNKKLYLLSFALLILVLYACRREYAERNTEADRLHDPAVALDVKAARSYFYELRMQQGEAVHGSDGKAVQSAPGKENKKYVLFDKAYAGSTDSVTFVESPLVYNKRTGMLIQDKQSTEQISPGQLQQFNSSFDRLIIYKNKKQVR